MCKLYVIITVHAVLNTDVRMCACVYSFQSRPSCNFVLSVLPLTYVGLCSTVYYCGFLWEFMGYQAYVNFHKSIPYLNCVLLWLRIKIKFIIIIPYTHSSLFLLYIIIITHYTNSLSCFFVTGYRGSTYRKLNPRGVLQYCSKYDYATISFAFEQRTWCGWYA